MEEEPPKLKTKQCEICGESFDTFHDLRYCIQCYLLLDEGLSETEVAERRCGDD